MKINITVNGNHYTVTRESKIIVGADWKERLAKTGCAGHDVTVMEVILANDPRFKEAKEAAEASFAE